MAGSEAAIRAAMMEELGLDRLDSLPMSDKPRNGDSRRRVDQAPKPKKTPKKGSGRVPVDNSVAAMWQSAITSGAFNDKDAADVKGLDDLGGGRIYDTRSRAQHAKAQTSKILQNIGGFSASKSPVPAISGHTQSTVRGTEIHPQSQSAYGRRRRFAPIKTAPPLGDKPITDFLPPEPTSMAPKVKAAPKPNTQTQAAQRATELDRLFNQLTTTVAEPESTVFKVLVVHQHAGGQTPSIIFLTASHPPSMGSFDLVSTSGVIAHHGLDQWYNYVTGSVVELMPQFKNSDGTISTYALVFHKKMDMPRFLEAITELQSGKYSHLLTTSTAKLIVGTDTEKNSSPIPPSEDDKIPSKDLDSRDPAENDESQEAPRNHTEKPQSPAVATSAGPREPPSSLTAVTACDDPFGIFAEQASTTLSGSHRQEVHLVSHLELLATLDPVPLEETPSRPVTPADETGLEAQPGNDPQSNSTEEKSLSVDRMKKSMRDWMIHATRSLLSCFLLSGDAGDTKSEIAATLEGIKNGLATMCMEDLGNPSFSEGLNPQQRRQVLEEFLSETFGLPQASQSNNLAGDTPLDLEAQLAEEVSKKPTDVPDAPNTQEKLSYSRGELLALKAKAAVPPKHLASPDFQPPLKVRMAPPKSPIPDFSKASIAMAWVKNSPSATEELMASNESGGKQCLVREEEIAQVSPPEPAVSQELQNRSSAPNAERLKSTTQMPRGLSSSRWTSGEGGDISSKHKFTGLGFEFGPNSAVAQLHRLAMDAKIASNTKADDILDLFVPIGPPASPAAACTSKAENMAGSGEARPNTSAHSGHSRGKSINELYESFVQLTIKPRHEPLVLLETTPPPSGPKQNDTGNTQPKKPAFVGLAGSRHA